MTTTRPPADLPGIVDRCLGLLAWICQVGTAAIYLGITFQPVVWQAMLHKEPVTAVSEWVFVAGMALIWMIALWQEQTRFYDSRARRLHRKAGLFGNFSVLFIAALAAAQQKGSVGLWIVLGMGVFVSTLTWITWMQTRILPAEDQAVIDAIHDRQAQQAAAAFDASEKERRRERLNAIVTGLGYQLTDIQAPASVRTEESSPVHWQIPAGKHTPVVYFIRNGNRMKIGTSTELKRRIRTLALRAENVALLIDGDRRLERKYHDQFKDLRIGTSEWFAYEGALADYVTDQIARISRKDEQK